MPRTKIGWTSVPPSTRRTPWFRVLCARRRLDPEVHRDRLDVIDDALRRAKEVPETGAEPLVSAITRVLVAALRVDAGERGAMQELARASQEYREALDKE